LFSSCLHGEDSTFLPCCEGRNLFLRKKSIALLFFFFSRSGQWIFFLRPEFRPATPCPFSSPFPLIIIPPGLGPPTPPRWWEYFPRLLLFSLEIKEPRGPYSFFRGIGGISLETALGSFSGVLVPFGPRLFPGGVPQSTTSLSRHLIPLFTEGGLPPEAFLFGR